MRRARGLIAAAAATVLVAAAITATATMAETRTLAAFTHAYSNIPAAGCASLDYLNATGELPLARVDTADDSTTMLLTLRIDDDEAATRAMRSIATITKPGSTLTGSWHWQTTFGTPTTIADDHMPFYRVVSPHLGATSVITDCRIHGCTLGSTLTVSIATTGGTPLVRHSTELHAHS